jgi:hypothetical protein
MVAGPTVFICDGCPGDAGLLLHGPRLWPNTPPLFAIYPERRKETLETRLSRETQRWIDTQV